MSLRDVLMDDARAAQVALAERLRDDETIELSTASGGTAAPADATYVVMSLNAVLTSERVLAVTAPLTLTDAGAGGNATIALDVAGAVLYDHWEFDGAAWAIVSDPNIADDNFLYFGNNQDVLMTYDEAGDDLFKVTGADWLINGPIVNVGTAEGGGGELLALRVDQDATTAMEIVNANGGNSAAANLRIKNTAGAGANDAMALGVTGTGWNTVGLAVADMGVVQANVNLSGGMLLRVNHATAPLICAVNSDDERWRVDATGMGVNEAAPAARLHVSAATATDIAAIFQTTDDNAANNIFECRDSGGNVLSGADERGILFSDGGSVISNIFIGDDAGRAAATGTFNVFIGQLSGVSLTDGTQNTFIGRGSGFSLTGGDSNVGIGYSTGLVLTTGLRNVFIGASSGINVTTGDDNLLIGAGAGLALTAGDATIAIGRNAGANLTVEVSNTLLGVSSGNALTSSSNVLLGTSAGSTMTTGANNVIIGSSAGSALTTSGDNVIIGKWAGLNTTIGGNVFIGYLAALNEAGGNKLYIANSATATPLIYGEFDGAGGAGVRIHSPAATAIALAARGHATQSVALLQLQENSGAVYVDSGDGLAVSTFDINVQEHDIDFHVRASGVADALQVQGSDGQITLGALGAGYVQSDAGGVLSSAALPGGFTGFAAPALIFTTVNAAGAATTAIGTDASLAIFDAVNPTSVDAGDAAAVGAAVFAARRDHQHAVTSTADGETNVNTLLQGDANGRVRLTGLSVGIVTSATVGIVSSTAGKTTGIQANETTGVGMRASTTSGNAVVGSSGSGIGGQFSSTSSIGVQAVSVNNTALVVNVTALGTIADFQDNGTPVLTIQDGGFADFAEYIRHLGDTDTYRRFQTNQFSDVAGGVTFLDAQSATGALTLGGTGVIVPDNYTIGLALAAAGRIEFDDQATDEINFLDCLVGIGDNAPEYKLHVNSAGINVVAGFESTDAFAQIYLWDNTSTDRELVRRNADTTDLYSGGTPHIRMIGGRVSIGGVTPPASALLELSSTTGALLVSRMTTAQRNALTAVNGMIVYNSSTNAFNFYENGAWVSGSGLA